MSSYMLGGWWARSTSGTVVTCLVPITTRLICVRGAHGSKGRTSWSGRPELDDYTSFASFFMHYISYLRPRLTSDLNFAPGQLPILSNQSASVSTHDDEPPIVVLGGYSYGSLILRHLPPVPTMLQPFSAPVAGTAADEIVLRARRLADQSNLAWINLARDETRVRRKSRAGNESRPPVTLGGEETSPEKRRSSRDVQRSLESGTIRTRLRSLSHRRREGHEPILRPETKSATVTMPDVRYLLVSPLTPPISTLAAPALIHRFWSRSKDDHQDVVGKHISLAIYGDQDAFTSAKRIRDWSEQLKAEPASRFTSVEVMGAGHFWIESDVEVTLRTALKNWESTIR